MLASCITFLNLTTLAVVRFHQMLVGQATLHIAVINSVEKVEFAKVC